MRLRKVKGAKDLIHAHSKYIIDFQGTEVINIDTLFSKKQPVHLEIGMGKGQFIYTLARKYPNINFIGVERFDSVIVRALQKIIDEPLPNLFLIRTDATNLTTIFEENSFDRIYLNFSDPWPKDRHAKRRLTHRNFLRIYHVLLKQHQELHFKTDNRLLFEFSMMEIMAYPMNIKFITTDLHNSDVKNNVMTEFEERFSQMGQNIHKVIATFKEEN